MREESASALWNYVSAAKISSNCNACQNIFTLFARATRDVVVLYAPLASFLLMPIAYESSLNMRTPSDAKIEIDSADRST
jgi:hypothetical protein